MTVLLREAIGDRLRETRNAKRRTLREVSRAARVSLGYLSEVERGRKEASSELLAAICDALDLPLPELLTNVAIDMTVPAALAAEAPAEPVLTGKSGREPVRSPETPLETSVTLDGEGARTPARLAESLTDLRLQAMLSHRLPSPVKEKKVTVAA